MAIDDRHSPWLTIVTVHKDDAGGLRRTLASIECQQLTGIEHLVIDSSLDRQSVLGAIAEFPLLRTSTIFMPPEGVYSAMNRGLHAASGLFVMFSNAGDSVADSTVVSRIHDAVEAQGPRWLFGSLVLTNSRGDSVVARTWSYSEQKAKHFRNGRFPQQPAMVVETSLLRSLGGFDLRFTVAADYRLMLSLAQTEAPLELDFVVARFELGGMSTVLWRRSLWEAYRARCEAYEASGLQSAMELLKSTPVFVRAAGARLLGRV